MSTRLEPSLRVKVSTSFPEWPLQRQSPAQSSRWGRCQFYINQEIEKCDAWIVLEGVSRRESTVCPPGNVVLIALEPPDVRTYLPKFLAQFSCVITCERNDMVHPGVLVTQQAQPWHVGRILEDGRSTSFRLTYDELAAMPPVRKTRKLSVICSDKTMTEGHRQRIAFVRQLEKAFDGDVDIFGSGRRAVADKWSAMRDYEYHVVIENSAVADYWTEKLADCYLAWSFPIYHGCPNIGKYFSRDAYAPIDIRDPDEAVQVIKQLVSTDSYNDRVNAIATARELVLNSYNVFPVMESICASLPAERISRRVTINRSPSEHTLLRRVANRLVKTMAR